MLLTINNTCIDTDYPEDYIEVVTSLLPRGLAQSVAHCLKEYKGFEDKLSEAQSEADWRETRMNKAEEVRDRVQDLLTALIENSSFDKDTLSAIKYIQATLDNI